MSTVTPSQAMSRLFPCSESRLISIIMSKNRVIFTFTELMEMTGTGFRTIKRILKNFGELGLVEILGQKIGNATIYRFEFKLIEGLLREFLVCDYRFGYKDLGSSSES